MSHLNLYGELPTSPVVFAACDSKYFIDHAAAFVKSSARAGKDVHIHVINPTDQVFALACVLNSIVDTRITYTFNDHKVSENPEEARIDPVKTRQKEARDTELSLTEMEAAEGAAYSILDELDEGNLLPEDVYNP